MEQLLGCVPGELERSRNTYQMCGCAPGTWTEYMLDPAPLLNARKPWVKDR